MHAGCRLVYIYTHKHTEVKKKYANSCPLLSVIVKDVTSFTTFIRFLSGVSVAHAQLLPLSVLLTFQESNSRHEERRYLTTAVERIVQAVGPINPRNQINLSLRITNCYMMWGRGKVY